MGVGRCRPTIFIDDFQVLGDGIGDINFIARTDRIAGVEIYNSPWQAPPQFLTTLGSCGTIAIWLQRVYRTPKAPGDRR